MWSRDSSERKGGREGGREGRERDRDHEIEIIANSYNNETHHAPLISSGVTLVLKGSRPGQLPTTDTAGH